MTSEDGERAVVWVNTTYPLLLRGEHYLADGELVSTYTATSVTYAG